MVLTIFSPLPGEDSHFDEHLFQMGGKNHQLEIGSVSKKIFVSEHRPPHGCRFAVSCIGAMPKVNGLEKDPVTLVNVREMGGPKMGWVF